MATMEVIQTVVGGLFVLTMASVGCRLLFLARRSRALPELLLGSALILGASIGGPLQGAGLSVKQEFGPEVAGWLLLIGKPFSMVGFLFQGAFVWRVFRPEQWRAGGLVVALLFFELASFWGFARHGTFASGEIPFLWFCVELAGRVGVSCWLGFEAYRYHGLMKRRLSLGLADPVVANRFLLWSLAAIFSIAVLITSVPPIFLDRFQHQTLLNVDLFFFGAAGVTTSALYWLTFLPPAAYRRRLQNAAEAQR